jgi:hypothetical protein
VHHSPRRSPRASWPDLLPLAGPTRSPSGKTPKTRRLKASGDPGQDRVKPPVAHRVARHPTPELQDFFRRALPWSRRC